MRARELVMLVALWGCATNPDPRSPSIETTQTRGYGGWIEITTVRNNVVSGELISVEPSVVRVLVRPHPGSLVVIRISDIRRAQLFKYESEAGVGGWGVLGTLSTISHGFFFVFSAPAWILTSSVAASVESRHVILEVPGDAWSELATWARFPQGMPPGLDEDSLHSPRRWQVPRPITPPSVTPAPPSAPPVTPTPAPPTPAVPAPSTPTAPPTAPPPPTTPPTTPAPSTPTPPPSSSVAPDPRPFDHPPRKP
jgi:hypothetical protein